MEEKRTTWRKFIVTDIAQNISPLFSLRGQTLMADRGALPLLLPPSIFPSLRVRRFQNPKSSPSRPHLLYFYSPHSTVDSVPLHPRRFSYRICAAVDGGRTERGKRGRKRRQLWEELLEDNVEEEDEGGGGDGSGNLDLWKILEEIVDNVWILKAFKSYGYLLPFIILSLFFSTGPKAFLVSLAVAIGPSLLFFAFQKLIGFDKRRRTSIANQFGIEKESEEEVERIMSRVRYNPSSFSRGVNRGSSETASKFGGWDELDGLGTIPEQPMNEPKKKRKKIRREEAAAEPLLLRLLVSLFPFLSSYTNMVK